MGGGGKIGKKTRIYLALEVYGCIYSQEISILLIKFSESEPHLLSVITI